MCEALTSNNDSNENLMKAIAKFAKGESLSYDQYDAKSLTKTTIDINANLRQWTYLYCNEFGFFMTPNKEQPMRSQILKLDFWPDYCKRVFGRDMETGTDEVNELYGGLDITGDNIFILNAREDPWQYASMRKLRHPNTTQSTMKTHYIDCDTCGHVVDLYPPQKDQPQALTDAQTAVADWVGDLLTKAKKARED